MDAGPGKYLVVYGDVLKRETLETAVIQINAVFGVVDALINAAGGNHPQASTNAATPFFDLPDDALRFVFNLNMLGTILPSQVFGQQMAQEYSPHIRVNAIAPGFFLTKQNQA